MSQVILVEEEEVRIVLVLVKILVVGQGLGGLGVTLHFGGTMINLHVFIFLSFYAFCLLSLFAASIKEAMLEDTSKQSFKVVN